MGSTQGLRPVREGEHAACYSYAMATPCPCFTHPRPPALAAHSLPVPSLYPVPSPPIFTVCAPSPYVPLLLMCGHPTARVFRFLDKAMEGGLHFGQLTLHLESDPNALDALPALLSLMFSDALKASEGLVSFDDWLVLAKSIPEIQEDGFATSVADLVSTHSAPQHEQPKHCPSTHSTHSIFDSSKLCMLHGAPSLCCTPHADRNPSSARGRDWCEC